MKKQSPTPLSLLILALLCTLTCQQACALGGSTSDLLQSDQSIIYNSFSNSPSRREHKYQFNLNFQVPSGSTLQVAASASQFAVTAGNGMDFSIWGGQGPSAGTGLIVVLIDEDNSWTSIRVSFLASARSDFFLGTFSAGTYFPQTTSPNGFVSLSYSLPGWSSSQASFVVIAEIAGIRTAASSFIVALTGVSFSGQSGLISLQASLSSSPAVETLVITYVIFRTSSSIQFSNININSGSNLPYQLYGIDRLQSGSAIIAAYGFSSSTQTGLTCIGSRCPTNFCVSSQTCIASGGTLTSIACFLCNSGEIISNGQCVAPANNCPSNQYFNGTTCVCNNNFIRVNGVCYLSCGPNAYVFNSQCQCIPGYTYSNAAAQCVQQTTIQCGQNFIVSNGVCVCPAPFGRINNICTACPGNSYINSTGYCTCIPGYELNPNTLSCALSCFQNAYRNELGQCVCINGFYNQGNQCIPQGTCTGGLVWNGTNCTCPAGQFKDSITGNCTYCNLLGRQVSNGVCVCSPTYYPTNLGCSPCPANSRYNSTQGTCTCNPNFTLSNGQCVPIINCPFNSFWNATTQQCQCNVSGQYVIDGFCQVCIPFSSWNGSACVCNPGYTLNNSLCQQPCVNATWNGMTCVCWQGYFIIGGTCKQCDVNSYYNSTQFTCVCKDGYFGNWSQCSTCDPSCRTCSGPGANQCTGCTNGTLANGFCRPSCQSGQYVNHNNQCANCIANCALCYGPTTCTTCATGFTPNSVNNAGTMITSCSPNPTGTTSTITLRGNVLANNIIYQGVAMSLMPTSIIAAGCSICNSMFTIDVNSQFTGITTTQTFITNTQYWFVITFNFPTATFVPTFEFTIKINPIHATYFTAQDMAQVLTGSFNQNSFPAATRTVSALATPTLQRTSVLGARATSLGSSATSSTSGVSSSIVNTIFG